MKRVLEVVDENTEIPTSPKRVCKSRCNCSCLINLSPVPISSHSLPGGMNHLFPNELLERILGPQTWGQRLQLRGVCRSFRGWVEGKLADDAVELNELDEMLSRSYGSGKFNFAIFLEKVLAKYGGVIGKLKIVPIYLDINSQLHNTLLAELLVQHCRALRKLEYRPWPHAPLPGPYIDGIEQLNGYGELPANVVLHLPKIRTILARLRLPKDDPSWSSVVEKVRDLKKLGCLDLDHKQIDSELDFQPMAGVRGLASCHLDAIKSDYTQAQLFPNMNAYFESRWLSVQNVTNKLTSLSFKIHSMKSVRKDSLWHYVLPRFINLRCFSLTVSSNFDSSSTERDFRFLSAFKFLTTFRCNATLNLRSLPEFAPLQDLWLPNTRLRGQSLALLLQRNYPIKTLVALEGNPKETVISAFPLLENLKLSGNGNSLVALIIQHRHRLRHLRHLDLRCCTLTIPCLEALLDNRHKRIYFSGEDLQPMMITLPPQLSVDHLKSLAQVVKVLLN